MTLLQIITPIKDTFHKLVSSDTLAQVHNAVSIDTNKVVSNKIVLTGNNSLIDSNILAAIIGALATLLCTIFWERIKAAIDARKVRRKKMIYFASLIKPIIVYSEKQVIDIEEFSRSLETNPFDFPLLKYAPKNAIEKVVNKIEEESFFNAYTTYYKPYTKSVRNFKSITSIVEYQNLQLEQILEMAKTSLQFDHERKNKFKEHFGAVTELAANSIANGTLQEHLGLLELLDKHLVQYLQHRSSPSDLKFAYESFIEPVKNEIVAQKYYEIPVGLEIANELQSATFVYHDIHMQMKALSEDISEIQEKYKNSNDKLKTEADKLLKDFFGS